MRVGDVVRLKEEHFLSSFLVGPCIVDEVKKYQISLNRKKRYHIKTLNKNTKGLHSMTWVDENEVIYLCNLREMRLNEIGI